MTVNSSFLSLGVLLLVSVASFAQKEADSIQAIQPQTQTAAWAQAWWMPRHQEKLAEKESMDRVDLLMIGDSITHAWESTGKKVWDAYYSQKQALNIGFSGDRTEHVLWRLQHGAVDGISPKLAVIMIGTNNTGHRQDPPGHTAAGVKAILKELDQRLPKTKILLLGIFPRGKNASDPLRQINERTNEMIKGFADDKKVFYRDIGSLFLTDEGTLSTSIMPDLLHPNERGYEIWAQAMQPTIDRLMAP